MSLLILIILVSLAVALTTVAGSVTLYLYRLKKSAATKTASLVVKKKKRLVTKSEEKQFKSDVVTGGDSADVVEDVNKIGEFATVKVDSSSLLVCKKLHCEIVLTPSNLLFKSNSDNKIVSFISTEDLNRGDTSVFSVLFNQNDAADYSSLLFVNKNRYEVIVCYDHVKKLLDSADFRCVHCESMLTFYLSEDVLKIIVCSDLWKQNYCTGMQILADEINNGQSLRQQLLYHGLIANRNINEFSLFEKVIIQLDVELRKNVNQLPITNGDVTPQSAATKEMPEFTSTPFSLEDQDGNCTSCQEGDHLFSRYMESVTDSLMRTLVDNSDVSIQDGCPYDSGSADECQDFLSDSVSPTNLSAKSNKETTVNQNHACLNGHLTLESGTDQQTSHSPPDCEANTLEDNKRCDVVSDEIVFMCETSAASNTSKMTEKSGTTTADISMNCMCSHSDSAST